MSTTISMRDALVLDLQDIVPPTYSATLKVYPNPADEQSLDLTGTNAVAMIWTGGGGDGKSENATINCRIAEVDQDYLVYLIAQTSTPDTTIGNLIDDVRNVISRSSGGNLKGVAGVREVNLEWEMVEPTSEDISNNVARAAVMVMTKYTGVNGSW